MSLEDLYNGKDFEAQINKQVICRQCGGSGAENVRRGKGWGTGLGTAAGSWEFWGFGILSLGVSLGLGWVFTVLCVDPSTRVESLVQGYIYMQGCFFFFFFAVWLKLTRVARRGTHVLSFPAHQSLDHRLPAARRCSAGEQPCACVQYGSDVRRGAVLLAVGNPLSLRPPPPSLLCLLR